MRTYLDFWKTDFMVFRNRCLALNIMRNVSILTEAEKGNGSSQTKPILSEPPESLGVTTTLQEECSRACGQVAQTPEELIKS